MKWRSSPRRCGLLAIGVLSILVSSARVATAQTNTWDSVIGNSQWYVPAANLLAFVTSGTNMTQALPVVDQTIWTIGPSVNGVFSGTSNATMVVGTGTSTSTTIMNGIVTPEGQVRISFSSEDTPTIIGIGQMREQAGVTYAEMQMITGTGGSGGIYLTHWAYMASYDPETTTLPPLVLPGDLISQEWKWMDGTTWTMVSPALFGEGQTGTFHIDAYYNGYFWGTGTGPEGSAAENFTLLGSATPEGNLLFNILSGETLTSLSGQITGTATDGSMFVRPYDPNTGQFGDASMAQVVPEPSAVAFLIAAGLTMTVLRRRLA